MKRIPALIIFIFLLMQVGFYASAQKIMMLNDSLKLNSHRMEAKRKGISSIAKYEFGNFKIVSGKAGVTKTKSNSKFFSVESKSASKQKSSFVFVGNNKDSVIVNTSTNLRMNETEGSNFSALNQSDENYVVLISPPNDTSSWVMYVNTYSGAKVQGNFQADGILKDAVTKIEIKQVKQWEDGKTAIFKLIIGYEFFINDIAIAAVQASKDTFQKKFVWIRENIDEPLKLILAAAASSILVHADEGMEQ